MSFYDARDGSSFPERRSTPRLRFSAPVEVHLPAGIRHGQMRDISEDGAMIAIDNPPTKGATVKLRWASHEVYGWVMWSDESGCGLKFARSISRGLVLEITGQDALGLAAPVADHSNIPLGRKRSRLAGGL